MQCFGCAGAMDRTVKLWDLGAGVQLASSRYQPSGVRALALDAGLLVTSASKVPHWLSCQMLFLPPQKLHVLDMAISRNPLKPLGCVACSQKGSLRVWRAGAGDGRFDLDASRELTGHTGPVTTVALSEQCALLPTICKLYLRIWPLAHVRNVALETLTSCYLACC